MILTISIVTIMMIRLVMEGPCPGRRQEGRVLHALPEYDSDHSNHIIIILVIMIIMTIITMIITLAITITVMILTVIVTTTNNDEGPPRR